MLLTRVLECPASLCSQLSTSTPSRIHVELQARCLSTPENNLSLDQSYGCLSEASIQRAEEVKACSLSEATAMRHGLALRPQDANGKRTDVTNVKL